MNVKDLLMQTASIAEIERIIQSAEAKVSFWGSRYISFTDPEYEGTLHIDDLAARVIQIAKERGFEFTQEERVTGRDLAQRITQLYDNCDALVDQVNCLTYCFIKLRKVFSLVFGSGMIMRDENSSNVCGVGICSRTEWAWISSTLPFICIYAYVFDYYTDSQAQRENIKISPGIVRLCDPDVDPLDERAFSLHLCLTSRISAN